MVMSSRVLNPGSRRESRCWKQHRLGIVSTIQGCTIASFALEVVLLQRPVPLAEARRHAYVYWHAGQFQERCFDMAIA